MNNEQKKQEIKKLVIDMLNESNSAMIKKIDTILESGSVDVENWNSNINGMILPKIVVTALLTNESTQRNGIGTSFEKHIKKSVKNILNSL